MDAPERIWTAPTKGECHVGFASPSMNYTIEWVLGTQARRMLIDERQRWWTPEYPGQAKPTLAVWFRDEPETGLSGFDTEGDRDRHMAGERGPFFRRVTGNTFPQNFGGE